MTRWNPETGQDEDGSLVEAERPRHKRWEPPRSLRMGDLNDYQRLTVIRLVEAIRRRNAAR